MKSSPLPFAFALLFLLALSACVADLPGPALLATPDAAPTASLPSAHLRYLSWSARDPQAGPALAQLAERFHQRYPTLTVEIVPVSFGALRTEALSAAARSDLPDVIQLTGGLPQELGALGLLRDLAPLAPPTALADQWPGALEAGSLEGKLYALPLGLGPQVLWWNPALFQQCGLNPEQAPATLDDLAATAAALRACLPPEAQALGLDGSVTSFWPLMLASGSRANLRHALDFNTPETLAAFGLYQQAVQAGWSRPDRTGGIVAVRQAMGAGQVAMMFDGPYLAQLLPQLELRAAAFPAQGGGVLADGHFLAISANSDAPEAAWLWLDFLTSDRQALTEGVLAQGLIAPRPSQAPDRPAWGKPLLSRLWGGLWGADQAALQAPLRAALADLERGAPLEARLQELSKDLGVLRGQ